MFFFFFCNCDDQETGVAGGFCAGCMADEDNDKSSGFGEGSVLINMSCDKFISFGIRDVSPIVAF